ncbi:MAG: PH domain-containing protein [Phycisphaerae bacterium]|nr:PH domain-containing protein [Phycisphaerae bacterium]
MTNHGDSPMTPTGSAIPALASDQAIPDRVLRSGEQIILIVKPSVWFVLLNSIQPLVILGIMIAVAASGDAIGVAMNARIRNGLLLGLILGLGLTLTLSCCRWFGRLYVLTDRRLLRISGIARVNVYECELARISSVDVVQTFGERIVGIGSLKFQIKDNPYSNPEWVNLAQTQHIADEVRTAVSRAKNF